MKSRALLSADYAVRCILKLSGAALSLRVGKPLSSSLPHLHEKVMRIMMWSSYDDDLMIVWWWYDQHDDDAMIITKTTLTSLNDKTNWNQKVVGHTFHITAIDALEMLMHLKLWYFDELTESDSGNRKNFKRQKDLNVKRSFPRCPSRWPLYILISPTPSFNVTMCCFWVTHTYICVSLIPRLKEITLVPTKPPALLYQHSTASPFLMDLAKIIHDKKIPKITTKSKTNHREIQ